ncbi:Ribosome-associated heat shock protein implicated in the recycling of the 50S subunit [Roseibacterium elongatum DSM 19469]|uniref:Ribosome-associated heat shock protein implicated in the recycling of the 50S subunit n=1 Tax=Roseicyclus elongatus DSM 19469 TaxID=1294273 RepID=W8S2D4_9RHOB|nr:RNA-binding S4 domain-containing protein [Roseibacterium elongatum]AHM04362.1 Ribosome-associated heat shock protein implicated in the recycling of the 50S subunit [Roseibacterium elongatum DSM 19469]
MTDPRPTDRLDRWLWQARFFKTRSMAARQVADAGVRINGARVSKPAASIGVDDVLTFAQGRHIRVVRILSLAKRRGPASEARMLYDDLSPPDAASPAPQRIGPRPTKKDRRSLDALRGDPPDEI